MSKPSTSGFGTLSGSGSVNVAQDEKTPIAAGMTYVNYNHNYNSHGGIYSPQITLSLNQNNNTVTCSMSCGSMNGSAFSIYPRVDIVVFYE